MPFDSLPNERQSYLLQKIAAVYELLDSEQKWCKYRLRSPDGSRCLLGALTDARARLVLHRPMLNAAYKVTGHRYYRIDGLNDDPLTKYSTVQEVLEQVRIDVMAGLLPRGWGYGLGYKISCILERSGIAATLGWVELAAATPRTHKPHSDHVSLQQNMAETGLTTKGTFRGLCRR